MNHNNIDGEIIIDNVFYSVENVIDDYTNIINDVISNNVSNSIIYEHDFK